MPSTNAERCARYCERNLDRVREIQRDFGNRRYRVDRKYRDSLLARSKRKRLASYGLTEADYLELLAAQEGLCAICALPESVLTSDGSPRALAVDHDHVSGSIRALLCGRCNLLLGKVNDDPGLLRVAAQYLERHLGGGDVENMERSNA